jgi:hypothetical protein
MGVVGCLLMISRFVMFRSFRVVLRRVGMMLSGLLVMIYSFFRHEYFLLMC